MNKLKGAWSSLQDQTQNMVKVGKLKLDQSSLEQQKKKMLQKLGSITVSQHEALALSDEGKHIVGEILKLEERIAMQENQIKETTQGPSPMEQNSVDENLTAVKTDTHSAK